MPSSFDPAKDAANRKKYALQGEHARIISVRKAEPKEIRNYEEGV
jgi:uncharacterized DUF497 family protein